MKTSCSKNSNIHNLTLLGFFIDFFSQIEHFSFGLTENIPKPAKYPSKIPFNQEKLKNGPFLPIFGPKIGHIS